MAKAKEEESSLIVIEKLTVEKIFKKEDSVDPYIAMVEKAAENLIKDADINTSKGRSAIVSAAYAVKRTKKKGDDAAKALKEHITKEAAGIDPNRKKWRDDLDALSDRIRLPVTEFEEKKKAKEERVVSELGNLQALPKRYFEEVELSLEDMQSRLKQLEGYEPTEEVFGDMLDSAKTLRTDGIETQKGYIAEKIKQDEADQKLADLEKKENDRIEIDRFKENINSLTISHYKNGDKLEAGNLKMNLSTLESLEIPEEIKEFEGSVEGYKKGKIEDLKRLIDLTEREEAADKTEADRKKAIKDRINTMIEATALHLSSDMSSTILNTKIEKLRDTAIDPSFMEYKEEAEREKANCLNSLQALHDKKKIDEDGAEEKAKEIEQKRVDDIKVRIAKISNIENIISVDSKLDSLLKSLELTTKEIESFQEFKELAADAIARASKACEAMKVTIADNKRKLDEDHRKKLIDESLEAMLELDPKDMLEALTLIADGEIPNITFNF